ncbi:MAG: GNAT family N-acetyltransferase [Christensenellaceae bacterium]|nr:GNAT family N-acetyltransferase [Christensenellaceae bacterium]
MRYFEKIAGERLYLSPINEDDAPLYTRWMNDPLISKNLGSAQRLLGLFAEAQAVQGLARSETDYHFAIVLREEDRLIGGISLMRLNFIDRRGECGLFIGEEGDRGKGYGAEALRLRLGYAFLVLGLHSASLNVFAFNQRAIACYEKVGFQESGRRREAHYADGRFHDTIMMDILAAEYGLLYPKSDGDLGA